MFDKNLQKRLLGVGLTVVFGTLVSACYLASDSQELALHGNDMLSCTNETHQTEEVSWVSWLTGRSPSYRFHYLDLLELLSRQSSSDSE